VGVARYIRTGPGSTDAEAAVTVIDEYHRRGIGSILLEALAAVALTNGITSFLLHVRSNNRPMASTMSELGAHASFSDEAGTLEYRMDLPAVANDVRNTPMWSVFKLVGAGDELVAGPRFDHRRGEAPLDDPSGSDRETFDLSRPDRETLDPDQPPA
ncbi:MAG: GNAT family N-acetyltransferase, partial [Actinobacteria bacterium]|nr:GNAT family N-acetyltransferase [Actinomycetota bacterium]